LKTKGKKKKESKKDQQLKEYISLIFHEHKGRYGYRKIHAVLNNQYQLPVSEKVVRRLIMRELGLKCQSRMKRKQPAKVKKATSAGYIYENLLKRNFSTTRLNEKWVTDVTEIAVEDKKLFVSAVMDLHNNEIIGHQISSTHDVQLVEDSLLYALEIRHIKDSLILHSDQGMPYRSTRWKTLMDTFSITPSMSRKANALDNACIESFFSYLKTEIEQDLQRTKSVEEATQLVHDYIRYYNHQRIQGVLHYQTPTQYAKAS